MLAWKAPLGSWMASTRPPNSMRSKVKAGWALWLTAAKLRSPPEPPKISSPGSRTGWLPLNSSRRAWFWPGSLSQMSWPWLASSGVSARCRVRKTPAALGPMVSGAASCSTPCRLSPAASVKATESFAPVCASGVDSRSTVQGEQTRLPERPE